MKYSINITEEDFLRFNIEHIKISKSGKIATGLLCISCILLTALGGIVFFSIAKGYSYPTFIPTTETIVLVIFMIIYLAFFRQKIFNKTLKRMIKLQKKDGKLPFTENSTIEFCEEEIYESTESSSNHIKYSELTKVHYTDNEMYLYIDSQRALIIPYSQLGEDKEKVVNFIKQKTNNSGN